MSARRRVGALLSAACIAAAMLPLLAGEYILSLATLAMVAAMIALSAHLLSIAGLPSLGQAAFAGVGAYTATYSARNWTELAVAGLALGVLVSAAAGAPVGILVSRTRAAAFMIATLAVGYIAHTIAERATTLTHGGNGLTSPASRAWPAGPLLAGDGEKFLYALAIFLATTGTVGYLTRSRFCLVLRAIADHEQRMRANGYHTTILLWTAYIVAAAIGGAAGTVLAATRNYVAPIDISFEISATALISAIIGRGRIPGTVLAAIGIVVIEDLLANVVEGLTPLLLGAAFTITALALSVMERRDRLRRKRSGLAP